jgi:putative ABC transport system permease protein
MLIRLLWGQLKRRPLTTTLHLTLISLGTAAMLIVTHMVEHIAEKGARDARGIDLVVGAKGSPVQLVLAGVYHSDVASGNVPLDDVNALAQLPLVKSVVPLSIGDSFSGARIVGTTPAFIDHYRATFAGGGLWSAPMDAVLGSDIAKKTGLQVGASFVGSHGMSTEEGGAGGGLHADHPYLVTGILKPTGTVADRLVLTGLDSVWVAHGLADGPKEVTLALVSYASPLAAAFLPRTINASPRLQAASPALESARLMTIFAWVANILRGFAGLVLVVAALSVFAALLQALADRRYDVAVLRALGARRRFVTQLLLAEALLLASLGAILGAVLARLAVMTIAQWLPDGLGMQVGAPSAAELGIISAVVAFAVGVAAWPAWRAYRFDAAQVLAQGR